ncbi:Protein of unknown function [Evansella caseinilytica]|uniref:DUF3939 domain-containing protein n=1 Tax=Evansella caseinilytica TaxID=1503961 RepID=A0A1H3J3K9_9BACI|nr:DUF3939 domain-containing protein [Evansella caseinilytica]SDY34387.1 Protein of unknown function [Evansella caseinilytica]
MFFFKGARKKKRKELPEQKLPEILSLTMEDVRQAVNEYASNLPKGISLRSIIQDDHQIDFKQLQSQIGGIPDKRFYMSKETFEIFEDPAYPKYIDLCQIACDQYLAETGEEPIAPGDPYRKISFAKLQHYLTEKPPFDLYLHPDDRMVTHRNPKDN